MSKPQGPWAVVSQADLPESMTVVTVETSEEAALLISAAPELLGVAQAVFDDRHEPGMNASLMVRLAAAIRKATTTERERGQE